MLSDVAKDLRLAYALEVTRGESVCCYAALLVLPIGAGTGAVTHASQGWLQLDVDDEQPASELAGTSPVLARWPHMEPAKQSVWARGVTLGRLKSYVTSGWIVHALGDTTLPVSKLSVHRLNFAWHRTELDRIVIAGFFEAAEEFEPTVVVAPAHLPRPIAAVLDEDDGDVDWEKALRPGKRQMFENNPPHDGQPDADIGEFGGDFESLEEGLVEILEEHAAREEALIREHAVAEGLDSGGGSSDDNGGSSSLGSSSVNSDDYVSLGELSDFDEPPEAHPVARRPRAERSSDMPWEKRPFHDDQGVFKGWLLWDEVHDQLDAQCGDPRHRGALKCHVHRVLRKRPIGYLCAWLLAGGCCGQNRDTHFGLRLERGEEDACGYPARMAARRIALGQPVLKVFFDLERRYPPAPGGGEEPHQL